MVTHEKHSPIRHAGLDPASRKRRKALKLDRSLALTSGYKHAGMTGLNNVKYFIISIYYINSES
jgi:hypothetical protein